MVNYLTEVTFIEVCLGQPRNCRLVRRTWVQNVGFGRCHSDIVVPGRRVVPGRGNS